MTDHSPSTSDDPESSTDHRYARGEVLTKIDTSEWVVEKRMIDVDTGESLYLLSESEETGFTDTEILTESDVESSFQTDSGTDGS